MYCKSIRDGMAVEFSAALDLRINGIPTFESSMLNIGSKNNGEGEDRTPTMRKLVAPKRAIVSNSSSPEMNSLNQECV